MAKLYEEIDDRLAAFIAKQKMFFVATAPLSTDGHVNLSPKGYDAFRILSPKRVAYADLGGSGIETVAHARENGRITIMFCAFEGPALILRLYGQAHVMQFDEPGFDTELAGFPGFERARNIVTVDIDRIADSSAGACRSTTSKANATNSNARSNTVPATNGRNGATPPTPKASTV